MHQINRLTEANLEQVALLAHKLWPEGSLESEREYLENLLGDPAKAVFELVIQGISAGFAYVALRSDFVEGMTTTPVCYLEGIYIEPDFRRGNNATLLLAEAERWGKSHGCSEMGSDAEIGNTASIAFHKSAGFTEANRIVCFAKKLT